MTNYKTLVDLVPLPSVHGDCGLTVYSLDNMISSSQTPCPTSLPNVMYMYRHNNYISINTDIIVIVTTTQRGQITNQNKSTSSSHIPNYRHHDAHPKHNQTLNKLITPTHKPFKIPQSNHTPTKPTQASHDG
ncbi:hypothetical protein Droror1_Dr00003450 [Drosera rotundifolia]